MGYKSKPNIILIIMDSARSDFFGCYGNKEGLTPNVDKISEQSVVCENFYSAGSGSALSHVALFTGQHSTRNGVVHNLSEIKRDLPSLTKILSQNGYKNYGQAQLICPPIGYEDLFSFEELVYPQTSSEHRENVPIKKRILDNLRKYPPLWQLIKKVFAITFPDNSKLTGGNNFLIYG